MKPINLMYLLFLTVGPLIALAGVDSSGGGNAVVCRNADQTIASAEVLDLFEARMLYGLSPQSSLAPATEQARLYIGKLRKLNDLTTIQLKGISEHVLNTAHILPDNIQLQPINDSFPPIIPKGCGIEQLAAYLADGSLYISGEIWKALDETNKSALYVHESLYKMMRDRGATNSIRTRKIVGHLISGYDLTATVPATKPGDLLCETPNSAFWSAPTVFFVTFAGDVATLSFVTLADNPLFDRKQIQVAASIFGPMGPGEAGLGMDWTNSHFETGDYVAIMNQGGTLSVQLVNGLGNSSSKGTFPIECH